ncbi:MAG: type II CAAX endopeptidase family protein [Pontixanthobacter sp.]
MSDVSIQSAELPLWRKVVAFPLVSLVIALAAAIGTIVGVGFGLSKIDNWPYGENSWMAVGAVVSVLAIFALSKLLLRHLGELPRDDLPLAGAAKDLVYGFLGGGWLMSLCVGVAFVLGVYKIAGWGTSESAGLIWLQAGLFAGFVEEVISRGIIFRFIEELAGSWAALAISALVFGFLHLGNPNATVFSSVAISIEAGILLGAAYMYTRNLWLAIGLHAGWNVVQGYVWDVPVSGNQVDGLVDSQVNGSELLSGGAFGLEASIIALIIATSAGLWLLREAVRRGHVIQPRWTRKRMERDAKA